MPTSFKKVDAVVDFPKLEREILKWWYSSSLAKKYLEKNDKSEKRFRFLDGPITANNPMGVHHAWGRSYKDLFQRYKNMRGFKQRFQNGFDAQGLWVEVEVERELGFSSKRDIERYGIDRFVERCKKRVFKYAKIQTEQSKRLGYFMDWDDDSFFREVPKKTRFSSGAGGSYYTLSDENNYAIWHFLKTCHQKGWIYEGRDVVPWCTRCGTALSEHEIVTEGYKELAHPGLFVKFPVTGKRDTFLLAWTTTPWTLPANTALAVGEDIKYVFLKAKDGIYILARERLKESGVEGKVVREVLGKNLVGLSYGSLFPEFFAQGGVKHRVVGADFVTLEEGTGIVHIAPASGREDYQLAREKNLSVVEYLDEGGMFLEGFGSYSGKSAFEVGPQVIEDLKKKGRILKVESYSHRYPVCWRCGTELIFRLVDEWYIAMDELRGPMAQVVRSINWIPGFGKERELDWLRNMSDWLISKKRYWGLALPFYKCQRCGHLEVVGSKKELKEKAAAGWEEFKDHSPHRPWIDEVKIRCPNCGEAVSRIKDVGNPWLDAGIVSFSTLVDPKTENVSYTTDKKYWRKWFPFDFITESFPGQFRNWFYSLLAMSTVLEDTAPFKNVLGHALVRDERGREMHKSWGNAIEFNEGAERMGVDIMRWLYLSHDPATNVNFGYGPAEVVRRRFFLIFWNVYRFFIENALVDGWKPSKKLQVAGNKLQVLDRWVLSRLNSTIELATQALDKYDPKTAAEAIERFVVDDVSQWWLRRSRPRVGPTAQREDDKEVFYQVAHLVLTTSVRLLAPFIPFVTEGMYQNLMRPLGTSRAVYTTSRSVHLADWPEPKKTFLDPRLERQMLKLREIVTLGHSFRKTKGIPLRQPLSKLTVTGFSGFSGKELTDLLAEELNVKGVEFKKGSELKVRFSTRLTDELRAERFARELIRAVQDIRKEKGLRLDDKIVVTYPQTVENKLAVAAFSDLIRRQTLASKLKPGGKLSLSVERKNSKRRAP
ncbi:isoleucine--tRNA ligase [Candidatus Saccharibacteria bacterium]|nr:isoleucine--tRNA ligase [Candidatus Saccharibacteria bacterium]